MGNIFGSMRNVFKNMSESDTQVLLANIGPLLNFAMTSLNTITPVSGEAPPQEAQLLQSLLPALMAGNNNGFNPGPYACGPPPPSSSE